MTRPSSRREGVPKSAGRRTSRSEPEPRSNEGADEESSDDLEAEAIDPGSVRDLEAVDAEIVDEGDAAEDQDERASPPAKTESAVVPAKDAGLAGALVPADSLQRYLAEIRRYPLLDVKEEHDLAVRWREGGDREAAIRLVTANLRLVVMIARQYQKSFKNLLDLIQEGNIGLLEAVKNYDPYRGVRFPSYAVWWIRAYIIRYVMNNWRMVKLGTTQAQRKLFFNLQREKARLEREGFRPDPELIAERLSVKKSEVIEMEQRLSGRDVSVDAPVGNDGDASMLDFLSRDGTDAEARIGDAQVRELVAEKMHEFGRTLEDKERTIFEERMIAEEPLTLQEIGEKYGVSRERVRQIEERIKKRLRAFLVQEIPDISDVDVRMSLEDSKKA
jgi:RNA polymerase sigma-32 factor